MFSQLHKKINENQITQVQFDNSSEIHTSNVKMLSCNSSCRYFLHFVILVVHILFFNIAKQLFDLTLVLVL